MGISPIIRKEQDDNGMLNGREKYAKEKVLRLSDAYDKTVCDETMLELAVRVININLEEHHEILEKCPVLRQYSELMARIRQYQEDGEPEAYTKAVKECIEQEILKEYLERKGSEVCNMLLGDYNYELDMEVQREEAAEEARENEHQKIVLKIYSNGKTASEIAELLGEPVEEVEKILAEN